MKEQTTKVMRILIDLQGAQATHHGRGIGRYSLSLAMAMVRQRGLHEFRVLLNGHYPQAVDEIRCAFRNLLPSSHIHVWNGIEPLHDGSPENACRREFAGQVRHALIASIQPDAVLVTSLFEGPGNAALVTIDPEGPPTAVVLYDLIPLIHSDLYLASPGAQSWYQERLQELRKAGLLLSISEHSRSEAMEYLQWPADHVVNISTACEEWFGPVDVSVSKRQEWSRRYKLNRPFLMYTGGIDQRKNIERLIRSYAALPSLIRRAHQLVIVCAIGTPDRDRFKQEAVQSGLECDDVVITGFVPEQELLALYSACKAFVFPSWHEGFGLPVLEAMRCGKAVIASNRTSLPEVVGLSEALFDPYDEDDIRSRIEWVLSDDAAREGLERHARIQSRKFSWHATAATAIKALEGLIPVPAQVIEKIRPRLACVSPLPPAQSGISDYTVQLLKALNAYYDIEVIVQQPLVNDPWIVANCPIRSGEWFLQNQRQFDRVIYHFGNSHFHDHMLHLLRRVPGVVVLHDFYLSGLQSHHHRGIDSVPWQRMLHAQHGYAALLADQMPADRGEVIWHYPCNLGVLQDASGIIVHSEFSRRLASQWHGSNAAKDWRVIPLLREGPAPELSDRQQARKRLGLSSDVFLVCSFGLIGEHKLNLELLDAFLGSLLAKNPDCLLVFVGANDAGPYGKKLLHRIEQAGLQQRVRITGWTDPKDYKSYLSAADVGVQLRARSRGETSAAVLDCMSYGLPTIVNANGSMADLDADSVFLLPDVFSQHELSLALETLWRKPQERSRMRCAARQLLSTQHSPENCARLYQEAIEYFHRTTNRALPGLIQKLRLQNLNLNDRMAVATALSHNFPPQPRLRMLLVDISELVRHDAGTGIQRVTRAILSEWLRQDIPGWLVEPVWANEVTPGYRYARRFTSRLLGLNEGWAEDSPVDAWAGDVFLGLDLQPQIVPAQRETLRQWRRQGVSVRFVVYDLLPVQYPQFFVPHAALGFTSWLETIAEFDAAICISRSTRDALDSWLRQESTPDRPCLRWFHLGADVEQTLPSKGLPDSAGQLLVSLRRTPGFLMVGTLEPRKGHSQVLDAFEHLWHDGHDLQLIIVGKQGWMSTELAQHLRNHPEAGRRLHWLEGVSDECLDLLYQSSAALIAASYAEGYGLPLVEAARHGCPILARDIPVFREVAEDHAYYFSGQTGHELALAVLRWLEQRRLGREPASSRMHLLTWRQSAANLLDLAGEDLHQ